MKNKFLSVILVLLCSIGFAAPSGGNAQHWTLSSEYCTGGNMSSIISIQIDGVEQADSNLELGVFIGDYCVGVKRDANIVNGHYLYYLTSFGLEDEYLEEFELVNRYEFKLYDHATNQVIEAVAPTSWSFVENAAYTTNPSYPLILNFITGETRWELVTDAATLVEGDNVIIAGSVNDKAMNQKQESNNRLTWPITRDGNCITWEEADLLEGEYGPQMVTLQHFAGNPTGSYGLFVGDGFLYAASGTRDYMRTQGTPSANAAFIIANGDNNTMTLTAQGTNTHNMIKYNASSSVFSCYLSGQEEVMLYRLVKATTPVQVVATPTFTPEAGTYTTEQTISIECETEGATIYYTLDGTTPSASSLVYTAPFTLNTTTTVKAIAMKEGWEDSNIASAQYTFTYYDINVTCRPVQGGTVTGAGSYLAGTSVTLTAIPAEGYVFVNWTENGNVIGTNNPLAVTASANHSIVANFTIPTYVLTIQYVDADNQEISHTYTAQFPEGANYNVPSPEVTGYTPDQLSVEGVMPAEDVTVIVHYAINEYEIEVASDSEHGTVTGGGTYTYNTEVTVTATAGEGYRFVEWTENGSQVSTSSSYRFFANRNRSLVAHFEEISYELTIHYVTEENALVAPDYVDHLAMGATYSVNSPEYTGYTPDQLVVAGVMPAEDVEITVLYTPNSYVITVSADPAIGGEVTGGGDYFYGQNCTVTATPAQDYNFVGWYEDDVQVSSNATYTFVVEDAVTLVAHFTKEPFEVIATANPEEGGTITGAGIYEAGETVTLVATPAEGYNFINWTENGAEVATTETLTFTLSSNRELVANFELQQFDINVTVNPVEGGTVTGAGEYAYNEVATLTATPAAGYVFINWTEGGEEISTESTLDITVVADHELVANFEILSFNINASAVPANGGTVTGAGTYNYGETVTLTATANEGYNFLNWSENGEVVSEEASFTLTVEEAHNYVANFEAMIVTLTLSANPTIGGTVAGNGDYYYGQTATATAIASEGFSFVNWTNNGAVVSTEESYSFTIEENTILVANFEGALYTISVETVANGLITAPATAYYHDVVYVNTTPYANYHLASLYYYTTDPNVTVDIDISTRQFNMPAADVTIGAVFALNDGDGDVNDDGDVNILDVLVTLNYILGHNPEPFNFDHADMNEDGIIDIADVMAINAMILGVKGNCDGEHATYEIINDVMYINSTVALAGYQFVLSAKPEAIDMPGFTAVGDWVDGKYVFLIYNLNGEKEAGVYSILKMNGGSVYSITTATADGCSIIPEYAYLGIEDFNESAYSIYPVPARYDVTVAGPSINSIEVYNMMGQRVLNLEGINSDEYNVDVRDLTSGSYIFRINASNGVAVKNVIVVR